MNYFSYIDGTPPPSLSEGFTPGSASAVYRYILSRLHSDGPLGLLLRSARRVRTQSELAIVSDRERYIAERTPDWASNVVAVFEGIKAKTFQDVLLDLVDVISNELRFVDAGSRYPLYGSFPFLAGARCSDFAVELCEFFARAAAQGQCKSGDLRGDLLVGAELSLGLSARPLSQGWQDAGVLVASHLVSLCFGAAEASAFLLRTFENLPKGDARRYFVLRLSSRFEESALEKHLSKHSDCAWVALYLAEQAISRSEFTAADKLLQRIELHPDPSMSDRIAQLRGLIDIELQAQPLRHSKGTEIKERLTNLLKTVEAKVGEVDQARLVSSLLQALVAAFTAEEIGIFRRVLSNPLLAGAAATRIIAETILSAAGEIPPCLAWFQEESPLKRALRSAADYKRKIGFPKSAYMCWIILEKAELLSEADRLNVSYLALSLGRFAEALALAKPLTRIYHNQLNSVAWPQNANGVPWPYGPVCSSKDIASSLAPDHKWPRISVVVPSYNQAKYVRECLLSLRFQQYPELEVIVYDGGSTDGTVDIIKEFESEFTSIVVEPDRGQSDAINKGFGRATGELLHWLNTDDMLAPAACYAAALAYLKSRADVIAGACIEVNNRDMLLLNLPSAGSDDFKEVELCKQFDRWLRGHYFYQPEVFFSRRIWEAAGASLDLSQNFAMDFDLWLRFARAGARYERIDWPIAFFRKHAEQKTSAHDDMVDEQAQIINDKVPQLPAPQRASEIRRMLHTVRRRGRTCRYAVVSKRFSKIFSEAVMDDMVDLRDLGTFSIYDCPDKVPLNEIECLIYLSHVQADYVDIERYREHGFKGPIICWFWDNHHNYYENRKTAEVADVIVAAHNFCNTYLANTHALMVESVPLCITQWGRREADNLFSTYGDRDRLDHLFGGFVDYEMGAKRNRLVAELTAARVSEALFLMKEADLSRYFGQSRQERFAQWCSYKVSLCLPLRKDLSQRFFDAWLTGQIPLVPSDFDDLHRYLDAYDLARHVVTFDTWSVASVCDAYKTALQRFDELGHEGIMERHRLALARHTFSDRLRTIIANTDREIDRLPLGF